MSRSEHRNIGVLVIPMNPKQGAPFKTTYYLSTLIHWAKICAGIGYDGGKLLVKFNDMEQDSYALEFEEGALAAAMVYRVGVEAGTRDISPISGHQEPRESRL